MAWKIPFSRGPRDHEFDREFAFHIDQLTQAGIAEGLTPEEARRRAILEFGGREQVNRRYARCTRRPCRRGSRSTGERPCAPRRSPSFWPRSFSHWESASAQTVRCSPLSML